MSEFIIQMWVRLTIHERGQTMAEYAIVLGVISIGIIAALTALGGGVKGALTKITADI